MPARKKRATPSPAKAPAAIFPWPMPIAAAAQDDLPVKIPTAPQPAPAEAQLPLTRLRLWTLSHGATSLLLLGLATLIWATSLQSVDPRNLGDYGIVSILPLRFWLALVLNIAGFCVVLSGKQLNSLLAASHLVLLALILHGTPAIAYGTLRYSWAWKHIGVIDYIMRYGAPNRYVAFLSAYQNWPGLFFASAKVAQWLNATPLQIASAARFAPLVSELLFAAVLFHFYRLLTDSRRLAIAAIATFLVANWIGQDYFSPQATAYFCYLVLLYLALGPLRPAHPTGTSLASRIRRVFAVPGDLRAHPTTPAVIAASAGFLVLVVAMVATHQLTPFALLLSLSLLWISGRISPWYLLLAALALALWLLYFAAPFFADNIVSQIDQLGEGVASVANKMSKVSVNSQARVYVVWAGRLLTAGMVVFAAAGAVVRLLSGKRDFVAWLLAIAPLALFSISYGGEIHFRVYLFTLPILAFFAASVFFGWKDNAPPAYFTTAFGTLLFAGSVAFLLANNGKDQYYYFTPQEISAADWLYTNGEPGSLLVEGSRSYPAQFENYDRFSYLAISEESPGDRQDIAAHAAETFYRWLSDSKWNGGYILITRSQQIYSDTEGSFEPGALAKIEQQLLASPYFKVAFMNADAKIFVLNR